MFTTFELVGRELRVEGMSLEAIADAHGTPTYVYSRKALAESYRSIDEAFSEVPHTICFALKANGARYPSPCRSEYWPRCSTS